MNEADAIIELTVRNIYVDFRWRMCFVLHLIHLFSLFTYQREEKTGNALERKKCTLCPNKKRNKNKIEVKNKRWRGKKRQGKDVKKGRK